MRNIIGYSRHRQDEPILRQNENHRQHLNLDQKAAIAIAAFYEATEPPAVSFDYICNPCPKFNSSIALLGKLSLANFLAVARAISEKLAVLEQLQGAIR